MRFDEGHRAQYYLNYNGCTLRGIMMSTRYTHIVYAPPSELDRRDVVSRYV